MPPTQYSVVMGFCKSFATFSPSAGQSCYNPLKWRTLSDAGAILLVPTTILLITYEGSSPELLRAYGSAMTAGSRWLWPNLRCQITCSPSGMVIARYFLSSSTSLAKPFAPVPGRLSFCLHLLNLTYATLFQSCSTNSVPCGTKSFMKRGRVGLTALLSIFSARFAMLISDCTKAQMLPRLHSPPTPIISTPFLGSRYPIDSAISPIIVQI